MVEAAGEFATYKITNMTNAVYDRGPVPEPLKVECNKRRKTSVMGQIANIMLEDIYERLKRKVEDGED